MKKIISLILAILTALSIASCGAGNGDTVSTDPIDSADEVTESATESETEDAPYDGIFQVGFGRADITPEGEIPLNTGVMMKKVLSKIYVTCIAVYDGDQTVLIFTGDMKNIATEVFDKITRQVKLSTGVPEENIMFSATHSHSAPSPTTANGSSVHANLIKWSNTLYAKATTAAKDAIKDLADAKIQIGTFKTTGMAFVRRYFDANGKFFDLQTSGNAASYESEADDTAQLIRFVREEKKDILLANWQCHPATEIAYYPESISADIVAYIRDAVESGNDDLLFAFYLGASGNINTNGKVPGTAKYLNYKLAAQAFGKMALKEADKLSPAEAGKIKAETATKTLTYRKDSAERVKQAEEIKADKYSVTLMNKYGFISKYDVDYTLGRNSRDDKQVIRLSVFSFGDLAFTSFPYEMFDTNGMEVKNGSFAKMTFVLTCAGGSYGYVPSALAVKNGGYEVYVSYFEYGTAEDVVKTVLEMLEKQK